MAKIENFTAYVVSHLPETIGKLVATQNRYGQVLPGHSKYSSILLLLEISTFEVSK